MIKQNGMSIIEFNQSLISNTEYLKPFAMTQGPDTGNLIPGPGKQG